MLHKIRMCYLPVTHNATLGSNIGAKLLICCLLSLPPILYGQDSKALCRVHFDKPFYVSGEVVWYKIYLPQSFNGKEVSFEVKLVAENGHELQHYFLKNEKQPHLVGYFKIPFDQATGMYYLMVFGTKQTSHTMVKILEAPLPIYNDLAEQENPIVNEEQHKNPPLTTALQDLQVTIELERDTFNRRTQVDAVVSITDANGQEVPANLSISVSDWALLSREETSTESLISSIYWDPVPVETLRKGLHFRGQTQDTLGQPINVNVLGYYSAAEKKLQYSRTDADGNFFIDIEDFTGSKPIQLIDYQSEDLSVFVPQKFPIEQKVALVFSPEIEQYLAWSRRRKKTYQLFKSFESPISSAPNEFIQKEYREYRSLRPDDYEPFANLPEFLREVYFNVTLVQKKDKSYKVNFFVNRHGDFERHPRPPVFIVDGKVTRDADYIAGLDLAEIEQIDCFHQLKSLRSQFGPFGQFGVAMITTKSGDETLPPAEEADIFDCYGYLPKIEFPVFTKEQLIASSPLPTFRPQLYWNPSLSTDSQGKASFSFIQSDDLSTFCIEVVAQGEDGKMGVGKRKYWVVF